MLKYIEVTAKTEEEALAKGLAQLGLERDDVSVEILERGKTGFLGIGSVPAKVKLTYEVPDAPVPELEPAHVPVAAQAEQPAAIPQAQEGCAVPTDAPQEEGSTASAALVEEEEDVAQAIVEFQTGLFAHMGVSATPVVKRKSDGYQVVLEGENIGALIGHRGDTLDAIQQLTNYAVNQGRSRRVRIHVDAEGYRARREESLRRLARKTAARAVRYRTSVTLEPMNAYERHVIHAALQDEPDVTTYSTGVEPNRRTVVAYQKR